MSNVESYRVVGNASELANPGKVNSKRHPATTGAQLRGSKETLDHNGRLSGAWSDDEVWLRGAVRRTSGYASADLTSYGGDKESFHSTERAEQPQHYDRGLRAPSDFTTQAATYDSQQAMVPDVDATFTVNQQQLLEIVRRTCGELTATSTNGIGVQPKQLNYDSPQSASINYQEPGTHRSRASTVRQPVETYSAGATPYRVRWRSPSADNDQFFDALQSPTRSRSRSSVSRDSRRPTPSQPSDSDREHGTSEGTSSTARRQPVPPGDDSDGNKDAIGPTRRDGGRRPSPSPPPDRGPSATTAPMWSKWMKPDKFNGTGSVDTFLAQFDICSEYNCWTERDKAAHLKCCVTGTAGQLLWDTGCPDALTYSELRDKLRRRFGSDDQQEKFQAELRARRRRRGETLAELHQDIRRLMTQAYPGEGTSRLCEQIAKDYFITSLGDRDLELKIREREPRDLESAFKHAVRLEAYDKAVVDDSRDQYKGKGQRYRQDDGLTRKVAQLERKMEQAPTQRSTARQEVATASNVQGATVNDTVVIELKDAMAKLSRHNDELSKEVGRLRLLEEQRR